jgi:hypothetical protein
MGMYTGISFRLKVRKNTPLPVLEFMDEFFYEGNTREALEKLQKETGIKNPIYGNCSDRNGLQHG